MGKNDKIVDEHLRRGRIGTRPKQAFSLVELLIVIAVIALLISILLPSLARARAQARFVLCSTHLKEYVNVTNYYLEEHEDTFMPYRQVSGRTNPRPGPYQEIGDKRYCWFNFLDKYVGAGVVSEADWGGDTPGTLQLQHQIGMCPDREFSEDEEWAYNSSDIGYGYNAFWLGLGPWGGDETRCTVFPNAAAIRWMKSSMVKSGSECLIFSDADAVPEDRIRMYDDPDMPPMFYPFIASLNAGVSPRHMARKGVSDRYIYSSDPVHNGRQIASFLSGVAPVAFVDGHAEKMSSSQINRIIDSRRYWDPFQGTGGLLFPSEREISVSQTNSGSTR